MEKLKKFPIQELKEELIRLGQYDEKMDFSFNFWLTIESHHIGMAYLDGVLEMNEHEFFKPLISYMEDKYESYENN